MIFRRGLLIAMPAQKWTPTEIRCISRTGSGTIPIGKVSWTQQYRLFPVRSSGFRVLCCSRSLFSVVENLPAYVAVKAPPFQRFKYTVVKMIRNGYVAKRRYWTCPSPTSHLKHPSPNPFCSFVQPIISGLTGTPRLSSEIGKSTAPVNLSGVEGWRQHGYLL